MNNGKIKVIITRKISNNVDNNEVLCSETKDKDTKDKGTNDKDTKDKGTNDKDTKDKDTKDKGTKDKEIKEKKEIGEINELEENKDTLVEINENKQRNYYCYILKNSVPSENKKTYNGFTVDLKKRIRQHNSEITGGAKYTTSNGKKTWHYYAILTGFDTAVSALSCEWWIKHPTGHRRRPLCYSNPCGRILGLQKVLEDTRFKGYNPNLQYTLWIDSKYLNNLNLNKIKPNIKVMVLTNFLII